MQDSERLKDMRPTNHMRIAHTNKETKTQLPVVVSGNGVVVLVVVVLTPVYQVDCARQ